MEHNLSENLLNGKNSTIFLFGNAKTGKSYTMFGDIDNINNHENIDVGDNQVEAEQTMPAKLTPLVTTHDADHSYIPTPEGSPSGGMMDELYGGGNHDSLLKWSSKLEVEF